MDTYTIAVECSNCFKGGSVSIPKGTLVPQLCTCPNCGCETAHPCKTKQEKPHLPIGIMPLPRGPIRWGDWPNPHWSTVNPSPLKVTDIEPYPNFFPPQLNCHVGAHQ